jgi:hypothetical protein
MKSAIISSKDLKERWDSHFQINRERLKDSIATLKNKYTKKETVDMLKILKPKFKKAIKNLQPSSYLNEDRAIDYEIHTYPYECLAVVIESLNGIKAEIEKTQRDLDKELKTIKKLQNI